MTKRSVESIIRNVMSYTLAVAFGGMATTVFAGPIETVTTTNDSGAGSLRQAITDVAAGGTINITATGTVSVASVMSFDKSVTINGPGANVFILDAGDSSQIMRIGLSTLTATIRDITFQDGSANTEELFGFTTAVAGGGAIRTGPNVTLNIDECEFVSCRANGTNFSLGGAILVMGPIHATQCTFDSNTLVGSPFAAGAVGCLPIAATVYGFENCTFFNNNADTGVGGAIWSQNGNASLTFTHCTFRNNAANAGDIASGGAIRLSEQTGSTPTLTVHDNIIESNTPNAYGLGAGFVFNTSGGNVHNPVQAGLAAFLHANDTEGTASGVAAALTLSAGATVRTLALETGDFAIGKALGTPNPSVDARGFLRDGSPDSGAHEANASPPANQEINVQGLGQDIPNGDTTPRLADDTNFDCHDVTTGMHPHIFSIQNLGTAVLTLGANAVTVSGVNSNDFIVTAQPATTVAAGGGTAPFTLQFDPSGAGLRTATVSINNDDANENPYTFDVMGTGTDSLGATRTVVNANDSGAGSLRRALAEVSPGGTVQINATGTVNVASSMSMKKSLTIEGPGANSFSLDGGNAVQLFRVGPNAVTVTIQGITMRNGNATTMETFGFGSSITGGGAIRTAPGVTLNLADCEFVNCAAVGTLSHGGALLATGAANIDRCTFDSNTLGGAPTGGGAVALVASAVTAYDFENSTFFNNSVSSQGGAMYVAGSNVSVVVTHCTFRDNSSNAGDVQSGGAIRLADNGGVPSLTVHDNIFEVHTPFAYGFEGGFSFLSTGGNIHNPTQTGLTAIIHSNDTEGISSGVASALTLSSNATVRTLDLPLAAFAVGKALGTPMPALDGRGFSRDAMPDSGAHEASATGVLLEITCPADVTIDCADSTDPSNTGSATATGGCTTPTISFSDSGMTDSCPVQAIVRTWTAIDTCGSSAVCTQTITVVDGALEPTTNSVLIAVSEDTFLLELFPDNNAGGAVHVAAGTTGVSGNSLDRRGLIRFDLGSLPAGATVQSATVTVSVVRTPIGGGVDSGFGLHRAFTSWGEGSRPGNNGQAAGAGEATWANAMHPGTSWAVPGGLAGTDYEFVASATAAVSGISSYTWSSGTLAADLQSWVDTPGSNDGWFLISQAEGVELTARQFGSRESGNGALLEITYAAPGSSDPVITCPTDAVVECGESTDPTNTGFATAVDNCSTNIVIAYSDTTNGVCPATITRVWTATDTCGYSAVCTQLVSVEFGGETRVEIVGNDLEIRDVAAGGKADTVSVMMSGTNIVVTDTNFVVGSTTLPAAGSNAVHAPIALVTGDILLFLSNGMDEATIDFSGGPFGVDSHVDGGAESDTVVVAGTSGADSFDLTGPAVTLLGDAVTWSDVETAAAAGASGNDTYLFHPGWGTKEVIESAGGGEDDMDFSLLSEKINATVASITVTQGTNIAVHAGQDVEQLELGTAGDTVNLRGYGGSLSVLTGGGSDIINVGESNSLDGIAGDMDLDGGSGFDRLNILDGDDADTDAYVFSSTSIVRNATSIQFVGFEFLEAFLYGDSLEGAVGDGSGGLFSYRVNHDGVLDLSGDLTLRSDGRLDLGTNGVITGAGDLVNEGILFAQTNLTVAAGLAMSGGASILGISDPRISVGGDFTHTSGNPTFELRRGGVAFTGASTHVLTANSADLGATLPALSDGNRVIGELSVEGDVEISGTVYAIVIEGTGNIIVKDGARLYYLSDAGWTGSSSVLGSGLFEQVQVFFTSVGVSGDILTGAFDAAPDFTFEVFGSEHLVTGTFQLVTGFVGTATSESFTDATDSSNRIYRLEVSP